MWGYKLWTDTTADTLNGLNPAKVLLPKLLMSIENRGLEQVFYDYLDNQETTERQHIQFNTFGSTVTGRPATLAYSFVHFAKI